MPRAVDFTDDERKSSGHGQRRQAIGHPDDMAREDLARDIRFALKHKVIYRETKKAIRALPDGHVDAMAREIADYLFTLLLSTGASLAAGR